jgi:hypothetical protein
MHILAAHREITAHLKKHYAPEGYEVKVYPWDLIKELKDPHTIRVAEVSFVLKRPDGTVSGASWMQSDPEGLPVCAAVERCLLALALDDDPNSDNDDLALAYDVLGFVMKREQ